MNSIKKLNKKEIVESDTKPIAKIKRESLWMKLINYRYSHIAVPKPKNNMINKNLYVPKRVIISEEAKTYAVSTEMIKRVQILNPNVEVMTIATNMPVLPNNLDTKQRRIYLNETIVLSVRSKQANFIEVFASPGRISENLGIMGKPISRCPLGCTFCYLQVSGRAIPWNRIYVDMDRFKEEWMKEEYVYRITQTLWTVVSHIQSQPLDKVPHGLKNLCDKKIRNHVLSSRKGIDSDKKAVEYLISNLPDFLNEMKITYTEDKLEKVKKEIPKWYKDNKQYPLSINLSEYTDILGLDHITNYMDLFLGWAEHNQNLQMKLRSKAPNLTNVLRHKDLSRIKITIDLNTEKHINMYQPYGYLLTDRIKAVNDLQIRGARVSLAIEPIMKYPGYENDYEDLMKRISKEIDLSNVDDIKVGCVRYKTQLKNYIPEAWPEVDMFDDLQNFQEPEKVDKRWRYSKEDRIEIYSLLINSLPENHQDLVKLGAENPEIWEKLEIDKSNIHNSVLTQVK
ncbi:MAG: hypothetical protein M5R37_09660 [Melioribacteraceae bacterium]|nr:hypothetical protein [Melioribacteraceae bacterium]